MSHLQSKQKNPLFTWGDDSVLYSNMCICVLFYQYYNYFGYYIPDLV